MTSETSSPKFELVSYRAKRNAEQIERAAILGGPLRPWMKRLAEWHATQEGKVTLEHCRDMAVTFTSGVMISQAAVRALMTRDDWMAYREEVSLDILLQARKKLQYRVTEYADAHFNALKLAEQHGDYKAVASMAEPMIDRLWAKREHQVAPSQTVIVNLGTHTTPTQLLETELLPVEILPKEAEEDPA